MKREMEGLVDITDEIIQTAAVLNKEGLIREVAEALDESLDQLYSREARLVLGNQITILKVLQYLLTK